MGHMMYRYCDYFGDRELLRRQAYPFMRGALRVYRAMLERGDGRFVLPVSVSPEYLGSSFGAWGRNASFQLAAIHRLIDDLLRASETLGEQPKPWWTEVQRGLPLASIGEWSGPNTAVIGRQRRLRVIELWEGQPLAESHRHHSHLAGLWPFDVIPADEPQWEQVVQDTFKQWVFQGMGLWSGWCVPWASILHTHVANGRMAEFLLEIYERVYTNRGHNARHDPNFPGFSLIGMGDVPMDADVNELRSETMQMDAQMGAATAVQEMLLHTVGGVNCLFRGAPPTWSEASFEGMRTAGGFLVSARRSGGRTASVAVHSERGGTFQVANPWRGAAVVELPGGRTQRIDKRVLAIETSPGDEIAIRPGDA
jgi:hypothetical protein